MKQKSSELDKKEIIDTARWNYSQYKDDHERTTTAQAASVKDYEAHQAVSDEYRQLADSGELDIRAGERVSDVLRDTGRVALADRFDTTLAQSSQSGEQAVNALMRQKANLWDARAHVQDHLDVYIDDAQQMDAARNQEPHQP